MVAVALPDVERDLGVSVAGASWLIAAYLIAMAALQPAAGKLGDRVGRRPLVLWGLGAFAAVSLAAPLAPALGALVALRVAQAAAGALVFANANALVRERLPDGRRAAAFGTVGAVIGVAAAAGPSLGGALVELGGWQAIFLANAPLVTVTFALAARVLPHGAPPRRGTPFDAFGALALCALLATFAWLVRGTGVASGWVLGGVAVALAAGTAAFARRELRHRDPVLQPRLLRRGPFRAAAGAVGLSNLAMYALLLAVPLLLARRAGETAAGAGLLLTAMSAAMVVGSPAGARLAGRSGLRVAAGAGLAVQAAGLAILVAAGPDVSAAVLVAGLLPVGAGVGLANAALQTAALEAVEPRDAGMAAGVYSTGRYMGSIASAGIVGALIADHGTGGFEAVLAIALAAALAALPLAAALPGLAARSDEARAAA